MGFWERTWQERTDALKVAFGETEPPDTVVAFSLHDDIRLPGACALAFPPIEQSRDPIRHRREDWLYVTIGLSQPLDKRQVLAEREAGKQYSSRGFELGFVVPDRSEWVPSALYYFLTHVTGGVEIAWGDRFPFGFCRGEDGKLHPYAGHPEGLTPWGHIRAVLFWPYLFSDKTFITSTGKFLLFIATTITEDEWQLARQTTTAHLLLLLCRAGVGQRSWPERQSLLQNPQWASQWQNVERLSPEQCEAELEAGIGRWHLSASAAHA